MKLINCFLLVARRGIIESILSLPSATILTSQPNPAGIQSVWLWYCGGRSASLAIELLGVQKLTAVGGWIVADKYAAIYFDNLLLI